MNTYQIPFGPGLLTLINPTIETISVLDIFSLKQCVVNIVLESSGNQFALSLYGFSYETTWDDSDISTFVDASMDKYLVE